MRRASWLVAFTLTGCLSDAVPRANGDGGAGGDGGSDRDGARVDAIMFDSPPVAAVELWSRAAIGDVNRDGLDDLILVNTAASEEGLLVYRGGPGFPHLDQIIPTDGILPLGVTIADVFGTENPELFAIGPEVSGSASRLFVVPGGEDLFLSADVRTADVAALGGERTSPWFVAPLHAFADGGAQFVYGSPNQGVWIGTAVSYEVTDLPLFSPQATPTAGPLTSPQVALIGPDDVRPTYSAMVVPANFDLCLFENAAEGDILSATCKPTGAAAQLSRGQLLDAEGDGEGDFFATSAQDVVSMGWGGETLATAPVVRGLLDDPSGSGHDYAIVGQLGGGARLDTVAVKVEPPDTVLTVQRDWNRVGGDLEDDGEATFVQARTFQARVAVIGKFDDRGPALWLFDAGADARCFVLEGTDLVPCP